MRIKALYSTATNSDPSSSYQTVQGIVEKAEMQLHFKRASLFFEVNGEKFRIINSASGVPVIYAGDAVILHLSDVPEHRDCPRGIQILTDNSATATVKLRIIISWNVVFR